MLSTDGVWFTLKGVLASMRVFRNNGAAWGRMNVDGEEFDVDPRIDVYDWDDVSATEYFINVARRGRYEPAQGWKGC